MSYLKIRILLLSFFLVGCYQTKTSIPENIFENKIVMQKPILNDLNDINKAYIDLFKAYKENLRLLNLIEKMNKK